MAQMMEREMEFWAWGPFEYSAGMRKTDFWAEVDAQSLRFGFPADGLRPSVGFYMMSTSRGQKAKPWYLGKTTANTGFYGEIFTPHKIDHYDNALNISKSKSGSITLFSLATNGKKISYAGRSNTRTIEWLEKSLIGMALMKNPNLLNLRDTKLLRNVWVEGVFGPANKGRPYAAAAFAKHALR